MKKEKKEKMITIEIPEEHRKAEVRLKS